MPCFGAFCVVYINIADTREESKRAIFGPWQVPGQFVPKCKQVFLFPLASTICFHHFAFVESPCLRNHKVFSLLAVDSAENRHVSLWCRHLVLPFFCHVPELFLFENEKFSKGRAQNLTPINDQTLLFGGSWTHTKNKTRTNVSNIELKLSSTCRWWVGGGGGGKRVFVLRAGWVSPDWRTQQWLECSHFGANILKQNKYGCNAFCAKVIYEAASPTLTDDSTPA